MTDDVPIRASDAERDATMDQLRDAAADGRLSLEELADRLEAAGGAATRRELSALTADLPSPAGPLAPAPADTVTVSSKTSAVFGDLRRSGRWVVPRSSRWESVFGDVVLDLREAQVTGDEIEIDAGTVFGDVQLLVPEGVLVEVRARVFFGDVRQSAGLSAPTGAPRIVLSGGTFFGDVRVRAERLRERLAFLRGL